MKKYAIICDSSVSFYPEELKNRNIFIAPLSIIHNNNEYKDQIEISTNDVKKLILTNEIVSTSQPNLSVILELIKHVYELGFENIIILSVTSKLSGAYTSFHHAIRELGYNNVYLIDTLTLAGPVQEACKVIELGYEKGYETHEIISILNNIFFKNTMSYVFPDNLYQLKRGGRISGSAALLANMLKIKVLLKLDNQGDKIEKFKTSRTTNTIFDSLIEDLKANDVSPDTHILYFPQIDAEDKVQGFLDRIKDKIGSFEYKIIPLPAALTCHAGLKTTAIQWIQKAETVYFSI